MEHDLYGAQRKIWNMLRNQRKNINELIQTNKISSEEWERHFSSLYKTEQLQNDYGGENTYTQIQPRNIILILTGYTK